MELGNVRELLTQSQQHVLVTHLYMHSASPACACCTVELIFAAFSKGAVLNPDPVEGRYCFLVRDFV